MSHLLRSAALGGIAKQLLIPVAPFGAGIGPRLDGKVPAAPNGVGGWRPLAAWQNGVGDDTAEMADASGCNVGLVLGKTAPDGQQYVCLDFDIAEEGKGGVAVRGICLQALAGCVQAGAFAVRETLPHRAAVLFRVAPDGDPGTKAVYDIGFRGRSLGKVEVLARGQQVVVAGTHQSGRPIRWVPYAGSEAASPVPKPSLHWTPLLGDHAVLSLHLAMIRDALAKHGIVLSLVQASKSVAPEGVTGTRTLDDRIPPSLDVVSRLLDAMPHPDDLPRPVYVTAMRAVRGVLRAAAESGMSAREGTAARDRVEAAAIAWAARWNGTTLFAEQEKWRTDFGLTEIDGLGWPEVRQLANDLGAWSAVKDELAQGDFEAEPPPPAPVADDDDEMHQYRVATKRRRTGAVAAPLADTVIADAMQKVLGKFSRYVVGEDRWIHFSEESGWFTDETREINRRLDAHLVEYVAEKGAGAGEKDGWTPKQVEGAQSRRRINDVLEILKTRLSARPRDVDSTALTLQYAGGAIDLATGRPLGWAERRTLLDTRCMAVAPQEGPCPLFDSLVDGLCDHDPETAAWLWRYLGYALLGKPQEHVFLFLWGPGGNGKSVLLKVLKALFGTYAENLDRDVLLAAGRDKHPASLYKLKGKRLALVNEMPQSERWNEARLKALTGCDETEARPMHANPVSFRPQAAFLMVGQHIPVFSQVDESIKRRVRIIGTRTKPRRDNKFLEDDIVSGELPAIFARLIAEARAVVGEGIVLPPPTDAMSREALTYLSEQDAFGAWFDRACEIDLEGATAFADLKANYEGYLRSASDDEGGVLHSMGLSDFAKALRRVGALPYDGNGRPLHATIAGKRARVVKGVRLRVGAAAPAAGAEFTLEP